MKFESIGFSLPRLCRCWNIGKVLVRYYKIHRSEAFKVMHCRDLGTYKIADNECILLLLHPLPAALNSAFCFSEVKGLLPFTTFWISHHSAFCEMNITALLIPPTRHRGNKAIRYFGIREHFQKRRNILSLDVQWTHPFIK